MPGGPRRAACHADAAAAASPGAPGAWALVAEVARLRGEMDAAREALAAALALDPLQPALAWARLACIPAVSPDAAHERSLIARFQLELAELDAAAAADAASWAEAACSAFPLHYRGGDCLDLQRPLGQLLCRLLGDAYPLPPPQPPARPRIRVGFVGEAFRRHTITKLFGGWMRGLDRQRFEVIGYALGLVQDADSAALAAACDGWAALPGPLNQAIRRIREDAPDVLIFPEVGMDDRVLRLAALRLAPLQAAAWGHPVSTGLPTVDLFLSSAAMAPVPDHRWTTEARVDLPGIGVCVPRPGPPPALSRAALGLPEGPVLLLCVQSLFKYRPFSDALHVAVARRCPHARLVFIEDARPAVTRAFQDRLHAAFADAGLDPRAHLCWLPRLSEDQFMGLLALGDLFLDSPGWSGGNTTLEALSVGLPCLAFAGDTMRGRHCLAMVQALELPELCPSDADAWVAAAVALAGDADRRAALRARIAERSHRLFDDPRSIRALEALLSDRVRPGPPR